MGQLEKYDIVLFRLGVAMWGKCASNANATVDILIGRKRGVKTAQSGHTYHSRKRSEGRMVMRWNKTGIFLNGTHIYKAFWPPLIYKYIINVSFNIWQLVLFQYTPCTNINNSTCIVIVTSKKYTKYWDANQTLSWLWFTNNNFP